MAKLMNPRRKSIAIVLAALVTLAGGGVAFAYWTSTGSGTGSATTGESAAFTITAATPEGDLAPGSAGQTVDFTVTNPGEGVQTLTAVSVAMAGPTGTPWVPPTGCSIADYTAAITTAPPTGPIAAGASVEGTVTVTLANTGVNQDACQGEEVPLYFTAS